MATHSQLVTATRLPVYPSTLIPNNFRHWLPPGISRLQIMPMIYPVFSLLPAPEDLSSIQLAVEIDQPLLEPLEHAADLLQLEQVVLDLARDGLDCAAQVELLLQLAPVGPRLSGGELVLVDQVAPFGVEGRDVGHDPLHEGKRTVSVGEGKILTGHEDNLKATRRT